MPFFALQAVNVSNVKAIAGNPPKRSAHLLIQFCIIISSHVPTKAAEKYTRTSKLLTFAFCLYNHHQCFVPSCTPIPPGVSSTMLSSIVLVRTAARQRWLILPATAVSLSPNMAALSNPLPVASSPPDLLLEKSLLSSFQTPGNSLSPITPLRWPGVYPHFSILLIASARSAINWKTRAPLSSSPTLLFW